MLQRVWLRETRRVNYVERRGSSEAPRRDRALTNRGLLGIVHRNGFEKKFTVFPSTRYRCDFVVIVLFNYSNSLYVKCLRFDTATMVVAFPASHQPEGASVVGPVLPP